MMLFSYLIFLSAVIGIYVLDYRLVKRDWYNPLYIFLLSNIIYVTPLTVRYLLDLPVEGSVTPYFYDIKEVYPFAVLANAFGVCVFYVSYLATKNNVFTQAVISFSSVMERRRVNYLFLGWAVFFIGFLIFLFEARSLGGAVGVLLQGYAVTTYFLESPMLAASISMMATASFFFLADFSHANRRIGFWFSMLSIFSVILIQIILGRRAEIIIWGGAYLIFYSILIKKIEFWKISLLVIAAFFFLNVLGLARAGGYESFSEFIERLLMFSSRDNHKNSSDAYYTLTTGHFAIPFETLPILMWDMDSTSFRYGATLLDLIFQWIPRGLWPDKPYGLGQWYMRSYYDAGAAANEGRQFYYLTEGYVNFGFFGALIFSAVWGFMLKSISILGGVRGSSLILPVFISAIYTSAILILLANDLVGFFVAHPKKSIIWFVAAYVIFSFIFGDRRGRR